LAKKFSLEADVSTVLLTFTGFHDPFSKGLVGEEEQPGPIVTLARETHFDRVVLFSTPGTTNHSAATLDAIAQISPDTLVHIEDFPLLDPTDYGEIRESLLSWINKTKLEDTNDEYCVSIASGTPQMHVVWLSLIAGNQLKARILNTRPPRYVTKDKPLISEVILLPHLLSLAGVSPQKSVSSKSAHADSALKSGEVISASPDALKVQVLESKLPKSISEVQDYDFSKAAQLIGIVGDHPEFLKVLEKASLLAPTKFPILILGETGTGKELLARFIHHLSRRPADKFIPLNCAAIPRDLVESTLFGHKRGSFTGAHEDRKGKFDVAHTGTLFLDELGELPSEIQAKFLRVLQDGVVEPVGEAKGHRVDVRVIAATNIDIEKAIRAGRLREDLYYRLKVGICHLPALRERRSDIQKIALSILERINSSVRHPKRFSRDALAWLISRPWSGNVRDLENTIESAAILTRGQEIGVSQLEMLEAGSHSRESKGFLPEPAEGFSMPEFLNQTRRGLIERALEIAGGKQRHAAGLLGVSPQALNKQIRDG
jgi:DNA-binding NtrC family response regulator